MACRAGHVYSVSRLEEVLSNDERLQRSLTLGPEIIAIEVERGFQKPPPEDASEKDDS